MHPSHLQRRQCKKKERERNFNMGNMGNMGNYIASVSNARFNAMNVEFNGGNSAQMQHNRNFNHARNNASMANLSNRSNVNNKARGGNPNLNAGAITAMGRQPNNAGNMNFNIGPQSQISRNNMPRMSFLYFLIF